MPAEGLAAPAAGRGQIGIDVEKDGTGDVPGEILIASVLGRIEIPAHVGDPKLQIAGVRGEPLGGDERPQDRYLRPRIPCFSGDSTFL